MFLNDTVKAGPWYRLNKLPALLVWSSWVCGTQMGFLYSMASHCCFQQTVHHYPVWQESKHHAFRGQEKTRTSSLCQVLYSYGILFSHVSTITYESFSDHFYLDHQHIMNIYKFMDEDRFLLQRWIDNVFAFILVCLYH